MSSCRTCGALDVVCRACHDRSLKSALAEVTRLNVKVLQLNNKVSLLTTMLKYHTDKNKT